MNYKKFILKKSILLIVSVTAMVVIIQPTFAGGIVNPTPISASKNCFGKPCFGKPSSVDTANNNIKTIDGYTTRPCDVSVTCDNGKVISCANVYVPTGHFSTCIVGNDSRSVYCSIKNMNGIITSSGWDSCD